MKLSKLVILMCLALALITFAILVYIYTGNDGYTDNGDEYKLTIYHMNSYNESWIDTWPLNVDEFIARKYNMKEIVIEGHRLVEHIHSLQQLSDIELIPIEGDYFFDARTYYVFESKTHGKIIDVALGGQSKFLSRDSCMVVNGIAVERNDIFYDIIEPFLSMPPEKAKEAPSAIVIIGAVIAAVAVLGVISGLFYKYCIRKRYEVE